MPQLNAIGIVASEPARSIDFYRLLGLDVPDTPSEGHVDTFHAQLADPDGVPVDLDAPL